MTRAKSKRMKEALHGLVMDVMELQEKESNSIKEVSTLIYIIQASKEMVEGMERTPGLKLH